MTNTRVEQSLARYNNRLHPVFQVLVDRARPFPRRSYTTKGPGVLAARGRGIYSDLQPHKGLTKRLHDNANTCPCNYCVGYRSDPHSDFSIRLARRERAALDAFIANDAGKLLG